MLFESLPDESGELAGRHLGRPVVVEIIVILCLCRLELLSVKEVRSSGQDSNSCTTWPPSCAFANPFVPAALGLEEPQEPTQTTAGSLAPLGESSPAEAHSTQQVALFVCLGQCH